MPTNSLFFDDFSSSELNRDHWNVFTIGPSFNKEQQAYVDSSETIYIAGGADAGGADGGALALHPRYRAGFRTPQGECFDFISGRIHTRGKFDFTYGMPAARIKLLGCSGFWPAFCGLGKSGRWPECGEIDIMEYAGEADWVSAALHAPGYFRETPIFNKAYLSPENDATQWHIYSVEWGPKAFLFKVDDQLIYRVTRHMTDFFGDWPFDRKEFLILNFALGGNFPYKVNGVQKPYYGILDSTVQLIKADQARVLVDWVRVTQE